MVWEDHLYVTKYTDINEWKEYLDDKIQRFVYEFDNPLYIGEYGTDNPVTPDNWQDALSEEVTYLKAKTLCGIQWHAWDNLEGEHVDSIYDYFDLEESQWITGIIFG
jgi:hypothetical protein